MPADDLLKNTLRSGSMFRVLCALAFLTVWSLSPAMAHSKHAKDDRPRIVVTTDGEIDDRCSMVRFLYYNNEFDIEGIVHSSSKFHWKGDDKHKRHKWADEVWLDKQIDMYEKLYPNLKKHAEGYYTADELRKLVYTGNVGYVGAMDKDTPGSDRIVEVLLDNEPGPVYLQAWGGTNTIARALWKIQHKSPSQMKRVSQKAVIYIILDQDKTFRKYIQPNWPDLRVLGSFRQFSGVAYPWRKKLPKRVHKYLDGKWMKEHILKGHGPLLAGYESHNDGSFRSEGDTPSYWHQIRVGLRSLEHPTWGGWGGRFEIGPRSKNVWRGARDDGDLFKPLWRWLEHIQNDWAARADWGITGDYDNANHPPVVKLAGKHDVSAASGATVRLSVAGSKDPDGDELNYEWWQYEEPGSYDGKVQITGARKPQASVKIPPEAKKGQTIHVICNVTDDGDPPLTRYARAVITVKD